MTFDAGTMNDVPEKLDPSSLDIAEARRPELLRLFPEVRTEGDDLEVLDLLQKSYLGKVKMISIAPPTTSATTSSTPIRCSSSRPRA